MASGGQSRHFGGFVRLAVTMVCLVAMAYWLDLSSVWAVTAQLSPIALLAALKLHAAIILLLAWRWQSIAQALAQSVGFSVATRLTFATTFFNLILPLSVGGDVGRIWLGRQAGIDLGTGTTVAILDRITGLIGLGVFLFVSALVLPSADLPAEARPLMMALLPFMLIGLWSIAACAGFDNTRWPALNWLTSPAEKVQRFIHRPGLLCRAIAQSLGAHLGAVGIMFGTAWGLEIPFAFRDALLLVPVVILATMLPFSIGGWGLREAAAIAVLSVVGITAEQSLVLSLIFGLTQLAVSGVGSLVSFSYSAPRLGRTIP